MGLRVGAGASNLVQASPSDTLAGLKEAASIPSAQLSPARAPAAAAKVGVAKADQDAATGAFKDLMAGPTPPQEPGIVPTSDLGGRTAIGSAAGGQSIFDMIRNHPLEALGQVGGSLIGRGMAAASEMGAPVQLAAGAAGAMIGSVAGQKLDAWMHNKPQPSTEDLRLTATESALLEGGSSVLHFLTAGQTPLTKAISPTVESLSAGGRLQATQLATRAQAENIPMFKSEALPGTVAGKTARANEQAIAQGYMGNRPQNEIEQQLMIKKAKIGYGLQNIDQLMPQPKGQYDIGSLPEKWLDSVNNEFLAARRQAFPDQHQINIDPRKLYDGVGGAMQRLGLFDQDFNPTPIPQESAKDVESVASRRRMQNLGTSLQTMAGGGLPDGGVSAMWEQAAKQTQGMRMSASGIPLTVLDGGGSPFSGSTKISLENLDFLKQSVNQMADKAPGDSSAQAVRKSFMENYYQIVGDMAEKNGAPEAAQKMQAIGRKLGMYKPQVEELMDSIQKAPSAAIQSMVDKNDVEKTKALSRWMTADQFSSFRKAFVTDAIQNGADPETGEFSAKTIRNRLSSYGQDNVNFILGDSKKPVMDSLAFYDALQRSDISVGSRKSLLQKLFTSARDIPDGARYVDVLISMIKQPDTKALLADPDFTRGLYKLGSRITPRTAAGAAIRGATGPGMEALTGAHENANQPQTRDFNR